MNKILKNTLILIPSPSKTANSSIEKINPFTLLTLRIRHVL